ncbi:hypothetical protein HPQ32_14030 [Photobacterium carnosum]|uniref:hypothetical protein n=1 Tax=Photobacterium carnosum TaxID=2023717 RepID=UPI001C910A48|nr:hypothetical protein [Photobacterium carnosum]MBY3789542.1 hypothetical protein [Photobacterium carnosum]MCD9534601.1 hypothetical protein [Photobacterium carnosum]
MNKSEAVEIITKNSHRFGYGEVIHEDDFRRMFNLDVTSNDAFECLTTNASKAEIKRLLENETLQELQASDFVRTHLLANGKYFCKTGCVYRIALPSENEYFAARYRTKAIKAMKKAKVLTSATPKEVAVMNGTSNSLVFMMAI